MATKTKNDVVVLSPIKRDTILIKLIGETELITHPFPEKAKKMIGDKVKGLPVKTKEKRSPEEEYKASFYYTADNKPAIPAIGIKNALVNACRSIPDLAMTEARGRFHILGDSEGMIPIESDPPYMREDMVRIGQGSADIRWRPGFRNWSCEFMIDYNASVITIEQLLKLVEIAGYSVGLCEWRPEKNGPYGRFRVATDADNN